MRKDTVYHRPLCLLLALLWLLFSGGCRQVSAFSDTQQALFDVLSGEAMLLYLPEEEAARQMKIEEVPAIFSPYSDYAAIDRFAVLDLDGDGEEEAVLQIIDVAGDMGGYLILRREQGAVCGYAAGYRDFESLKTDGTYSYSRQLGREWGACRPVFDGEGYHPEPFLCGRTADTGESASYFAEGQPVPEQAFHAAMAGQEMKPDAEWRKFEDENIREAFS